MALTSAQFETWYGYVIGGVEPPLSAQKCTLFKTWDTDSSGDLTEAEVLAGASSMGSGPGGDSTGGDSTGDGPPSESALKCLFAAALGDSGTTALVLSERCLNRLRASYLRSRQLGFRFALRRRRH